jgi:hypothetical protein
MALFRVDLSANIKAILFDRLRLKTTLGISPGIS